MIDAQRGRIYQLEERALTASIKFDGLEDRVMDTPSLAPKLLEERFLNLE